MARKLVREGEHLGRSQHRITADVGTSCRLRGSESELHSAFGILVILLLGVQNGARDSA